MPCTQRFALNTAFITSRGIGSIQSLFLIRTLLTPRVILGAPHLHLARDQHPTLSDNLDVEIPSQYGRVHVTLTGANAGACCSAGSIRVSSAGLHARLGCG